MNTRTHRTTRIVTTLFFTAAIAYSKPGPCDGKTAAYNGYKILRVDIKDPIGFITPWAPLSKSLRGGLKLKANDPFSVDTFNQDSTFLSTSLKAGFASSTQKIKLSYASGEILDCDPDARTLRVVYPIFTTVLPSLLPSIEQQAEEANHPATTGATRASEKPLLLAPLAGYDQTRGTWGGLNFSDIVGKLQVQGESEVSGNSGVGHLDLVGRSGPLANFWNRANWAATFDYEDTPAGSARYKEGKLIARFSAATRESSEQHAILRYGASLEGGHEQSAGTPAIQTLPPNSGYGSLKLYVGATGRPGNRAFTASYGLQIGSTFRSGAPLFTKHILDLGYDAAIPFPFQKPPGNREPFRGPLSAGVHRSLNIETRLTGGLIQNALSAPLAERFLGGNEVRPFVQDDSWLILGNPFIRSIPENELGAQSGVLGGSRFYSANATVSFTVWGKSLLPKELAAPDSDFPQVLNPPFETAAAALANSYKIKDPDYIRLTAGMSAKAGDLKTRLSNLSDKLKEIPPAIAAQPAVKRTLADLKTTLLNTRGAAGLIVAKPDPQVVSTLTTHWIPGLSRLVQDLIKTLQDSSQADLATQINLLITDIKAAAQDIRDADNALPSKKYVDQAWQALAPGHQAIDAFLRRLNIYSIAPVGIFDVARVWPVGEGVRYGVGPGLRLSLVNANFTMGYAVNPQRVGREKAGAIFFKLDVTSLF